MDSTSQAKRVFVAATMQDQGKTTVSLGLMSGFAELCPPVGFMKPVGQRYVELDGVRVDEDVALMRSVFPDAGTLAQMSPITVGRNFTRDFIRNPQPETIMVRIQQAFAQVSDGKRIIVIEGTGHAGVGSCFDASNADVARLLQARAILIAGGGIGKPIDEVLLNESLFRSRGVELLGVILNKVLPSKMEEVRETASKGLSRKGIALLGCIPYEPSLANPTVRQVVDEIGGEVLHGHEALGNIIRVSIVGAMTAHRALDYIEPGCLLITPGDRDDLILAVMSTSALLDSGDAAIAGILLTGGIRPQGSINNLIQRSRVPVVLCQEDSFSVAAAVDDLKVKIQPTDRGKITTVPQLIRKHVDIPRILDML